MNEETLQTALTAIPICHKNKSSFYSVLLHWLWYLKHSPAINSFTQDNNQFASSTDQLLVTVVNLYFFGFLGQINNL